MPALARPSQADCWHAGRSLGLRSRADEALGAPKTRSSNTTPITPLGAHPGYTRLCSAVPSDRGAADATTASSSASTEGRVVEGSGDGGLRDGQGQGREGASGTSQNGAGRGAPEHEATAHQRADEKQLPGASTGSKGTEFNGTGSKATGPQGTESEGTGLQRTQSKGNGFSLSRAFDLGIELSSETAAIALVYFVQGILGLSRLAVTFFLKDDFHLDPAEVRLHAPPARGGSFPCALWPCHPPQRLLLSFCFPSRPFPGWDLGQGAMAVTG